MNNVIVNKVILEIHIQVVMKRLNHLVSQIHAPLELYVLLLLPASRFVVVQKEWVGIQHLLVDALDMSVKLMTTVV